MAVCLLWRGQAYCFRFWAGWRGGQGGVAGLVGHWGTGRKGELRLSFFLGGGLTWFAKDRKVRELGNI